MKKKDNKEKECTCAECKCDENKCTCNDNCECNECSCDNNEILELKDKLLRMQAEFMNFKLRTQKETSDMLKYEGEDIILKLLTICDNFERAFKMDDKDLSDEVSLFLEGFKMVYASLQNILLEQDVKEIECLGLEFDPVYAQAVMVEEDKTKPANVVLEVYTKGYMYKDKVIRPAMVKVNK